MLVDVDDDEVYLGELNPRISGASAITNVTAGAYADVPLFAFHLLEFMDVEFDLDVAEINERWRELAAADLWSHMIIKETSPVVELITAVGADRPVHRRRVGLAGLQAGGPGLAPAAERVEAFFLRIYGAGDYRWKGADLGVLVTKGRLQHASRRRPDALTIRAKHLISAIRDQYEGTPLSAPPSTAPTVAK